MKGIRLKAANYLSIVITASVGLFFWGCGVEEPLERITPESKPYTKTLPAAYHQINLKQSTSVDVLAVIKQNKLEMITQSKSVIVNWGEKKNTSQFWITMAAFNEEDFKVSRKYFLAIDEKAWNLGSKGQKLRFDSNMVIDEATLSEPYPGENEKRIAIFKKVMENARNDFAQVRQDNRVLNTGAMMLNQTMERVLYVLKESPTLASKFDDPNGFNFDHPTLGKSRVGMTLNGDIVKIKIVTAGMWLQKLWRQD
jgi:hypothetical protein